MIQNNDCLFQDLLMVPFLSFRRILLPCLPYQSWKTKHTHHDAKYQPDIQCIFHLTRMVSCFLHENCTNEKCSLKLNLKIKRVLRVHKLVWSSKVSRLVCPPISVSSEHISMFFRVYLEESGEKRVGRREKREESGEKREKRREKIERREDYKNVDRVQLCIPV